MSKPKPPNYWTFEKCKEEALKYQTRTDFQYKSKGAYLKAYKNGWLDIICNHMEEIKKINGYWTFEKCKEEALKYQTRCEFTKGSSSAYHKAHKNNWLNIICSHMKEIKKPSGYWTFDRCQEEASKYNTRTDFRKACRGTYKRCYENNWLDEICSHMKSDQKPNKYWTKQRLKKEALKYQTKRELEIGSRGAYKKMHKCNLIDELCQHMNIQGGISHQETELFELIKEKYPTAKKLRKRNINIPDKPNIQSFEIDIYIPELKKGIEFDGDYWHSFEGLKKGRPNWKEEDLKKYHTIKDNYFKSQGIEIIHIKESDWKENKEKELNKIWEFLQYFVVL